MRYTKTTNKNLYKALREAQEAEQSLESLYAVTNTETVTSINQGLVSPWYENHPEDSSNSDLDEVLIEDIEYVMETPSNEDELAELEDGDLFFEDEEEEYLSPDVYSENTAENRKDVVKSSAKRNKRAPLAGAGLALITDLVKSGKDISMVGGLHERFHVLDSSTYPEVLV